MSFRKSGQLVSNCGNSPFYGTAFVYKESNRGLADVFYTLSNEEMKHMGMLHAEVVKLIEAYRKESGEPPATMMAVYNYLHDKQIEKARDVKSMQAMYKEQ